MLVVVRVAQRCCVGAASARGAQAPQPTARPAQLGALAPANLAKPRPKAPFDLTGVWLHASAPDNPFRFSPPAGFKLTPAAQVHYDAARKAQAEGKVYRDDIGQCWPAGLPLIMTRVWPIAMMQYPTAIYMVSEFMNSLRIIYMDGRPHTDPMSSCAAGTASRSAAGKATRWSSTRATSSATTTGSIPAFRPATRCTSSSASRLINDGKTLQIEYTLTDPKSWEGEWKYTKRWNRVDDRDIAEVSCLPDLNDHMPTTRSDANVR